MPAQQPLVLRRWQQGDRETCLSLFDSNAPRFFAHEERADFIAYLDTLNHSYFMLEDDTGEVLGCGGYAFKTDEPTCAILCWGMIRGDLHRSGLGSELMRLRLARIADEPACARVKIETSQHSCGFFARYGFVETRSVMDGFAPGIDLVEMHLDLVAHRRKP